jgi:predicted alpha/beta hydrolase family esterase
MPEPKHPEEAAAVARICTAFETVRKAVYLQTHADGGDDPVAVAAVAANARLAMAAGGSYLIARLDPATPQALAEAVRSFAELLQDIAINALADVPNDDPTQADRLRQADEASVEVAKWCR